MVPSIQRVFPSPTLRHAGEHVVEVAERIATRARRMVKTAGEYVQTYGPVVGSRLILNLRTRRGMADVDIGNGTHVSARRKSSDVPTFEQVFVRREYDHPCLPADASLVIDAGANVGYASVFFAEKYPKATIWSIEPETSNFQMLQFNTRVHSNVRPVQAALWPTKTMVDIANPDAPNWAFRVEESQQSTGTPTVTVAELMGEHGTIDVLKIDIEGAEKELFSADCTPWLGRVRVLILELHDWLRPGCSDAVHRAVSGFDFEQHTWGENVFFVRRGETTAQA